MVYWQRNVLPRVVYPAHLGAYIPTDYATHRILKSLKDALVTPSSSIACSCFLKRIKAPPKGRIYSEALQRRGGGEDEEGQMSSGSRIVRHMHR